jgi:hypothetical protein
MIWKILLVGGGLLVAMGGPFLVHAGNNWWKSSGTPQQSEPTDPQPDQAAESAPAPVTTAPPPPVHDLASVLRFNITPAWIMGRWPQVSTGLANMRLQGYRVPLVTGAREDDLAGSLTYYFSSQQQVQQITFLGTTGNVNKLVRLLTGRYGFVRRLTNDPSLFIYERTSPRGGPKSVARISMAGLITRDDPRRRFRVELILHRPQNG